MRFLLLVASFVGLTACVSTRREVPSDFTEAEQMLAEVRGSGAGRALPHSLDRAQTALNQAYALLDRAAAEPAGKPRTHDLQAALSKANEATLLAGDAKDLGLRIAAWDGRIEAYAEEQTTSQLLEIMMAELTAACAAGAGADAYARGGVESSDFAP